MFPFGCGICLTLEPLEDPHKAKKDLSVKVKLTPKIIPALEAVFAEVGKKALLEETG